MDDYKTKLTKEAALSIVRKGRAGMIYRKNHWWHVCQMRRPRKLKEFTINNGLKNEILPI